MKENSSLRVFGGGRGEGRQIFFSIFKQILWSDVTNSQFSLKKSIFWPLLSSFQTLIAKKFSKRSERYHSPWPAPLCLLRKKNVIEVTIIQLPKWLCFLMTDLIGGGEQHYLSPQMLPLIQHGLCHPPLVVWMWRFKGWSIGAWSAKNIFQ